MIKLSREGYMEPATSVSEQRARAAHQLVLIIKVSRDAERRIGDGYMERATSVSNQRACYPPVRHCGARDDLLPFLARNVRGRP